MSTASHWHREPAVIASSHLLRRHDRAAALLEEAEPWDLVVLDEAHHARRRAAGSPQEGGPNALLQLMQRLKDRTQGLLLLTATPMQVHPHRGLGLVEPARPARRNGPPGRFSTFSRDLEQPNPSSDAFDRMARMFQSVERAYGKVRTEDVQRLVDLSRLKANKILRALRDAAGIPRRPTGNGGAPGGDCRHAGAHAGPQAGLAAHP